MISDPVRHANHQHPEKPCQYREVAPRPTSRVRTSGVGDGVIHGVEQSDAGKAPHTSEQSFIQPPALDMSQW
jgi:hypothetical protein